MPAFGLLLTVVFLAGASTDIAAQELAGEAVVETGDRLRVRGEPLRLVGILAPPVGQDCVTAKGKRFDCGKIAATALMDLTAGVKTRCRPLQREDAAGRRFARCTADGYDLSEGMVYTGWARAWPEDTSPYRQLEREARQAPRGLWRHRFDPPWRP